MKRPDDALPTLARFDQGVHGWRDTIRWGGGGGAEILFAGKGAESAERVEIATLAGSLGPPGARAVWLRQVHGARVVAARPGRVEEADALYTRDPGLVLAVVTADCVPVLLAAPGVVAAIHAGWRGIAAGVVEAALARLAAPPAEVTAWIGPAIGACCYEVGDEVATRIVAASGRTVARPGPRGRPHLDLVAAVTLQLARGGVDTVRSVGVCTRCERARLWSYRRDGRGAGRNVALIGLTS